MIQPIDPANSQNDTPRYWEFKGSPELLPKEFGPISPNDLLKYLQTQEPTMRKSEVTPHLVPGREATEEQIAAGLWSPED